MLVSLIFYFKMILKGETETHLERHKQQQRQGAERASEKSSMNLSTMLFLEGFIPEA